MKVLSIFGTRPEAIKMAPLIKVLAATTGIQSRVCVTAQHREMLDMVLQLFDIKPDYDLNLMRPNQSLAAYSAQALSQIDQVLAQELPDLVLVHGDTSTTFIASLAAFYHKIPIGHVEAGLRTANKYSPFPEEINRRLTMPLADLHFAPTAMAAANLLSENASKDRVFITGNTVIDALHLIQKQDMPGFSDLGLADIDWQKKVILLTCHRRENWGEPMAQVFGAIKQLLLKYEDVQIIFPIHRNPLIREQVQQLLAATPRLYLCEPLDYLPMCHVLKRCYMVLTDSGGLQEEAPAFGKPVLVLRQTTERPEAIEAGVACLVGTEQEAILAKASRLIEDQAAYQQMAQAISPYGDGTASLQIRDIILAYQQANGRA